MEKTTKTTKTTTNNLKVTYVKSYIGYNKNQEKIIRALGFTKLNQTRIFPDNECIQGSLFKVKHLVKVEKA